MTLPIPASPPLLPSSPLLPSLLRPSSFHEYPPALPSTPRDPRITLPGFPESPSTLQRLPRGTLGTTDLAQPRGTRTANVQPPDESQGEGGIQHQGGSEDRLWHEGKTSQSTQSRTWHPYFVKGSWKTSSSVGVSSWVLAVSNEKIESQGRPDDQGGTPRCLRRYVASQWLRQALPIDTREGELEHEQQTVERTIARHVFTLSRSGEQSETTLSASTTVRERCQGRQR